VPAPISVVGAGLSGLTAAAALNQAGRSVIVLEARDRIGGRAWSVERAGARIDLGPAWVWPAEQPYLAATLDKLGLNLTEQYETGEFLYDTGLGLQRHAYPKRYANARRVIGGADQIARALAATLPADAIRLGTPVTGIDAAAAGVTLHTGSEPIDAAAAILALPPRRLTALRLTPTPPDSLLEAAARTPTWMAAHAKFAAIYDRPFWREAGLSGTALSQAGPMMEIVDQSPDSAGPGVLVGFVSWSARKRRAEAAGLRAAALAQLERLFGARAATPRDTLLQDWSFDIETASEADQAPLRHHPVYGDPALSQAWAGGRLIPAGAETSAQSGGLIEGAVLSGARAAEAALAL
jgi:monoamine oxidase